MVAKCGAEMSKQENLEFSDDILKKMSKQESEATREAKYQTWLKGARADHPAMQVCKGLPVVAPGAQRQKGPGKPWGSGLPVTFPAPGPVPGAQRQKGLKVTRFPGPTGAIGPPVFYCSKCKVMRCLAEKSIENQVMEKMTSKDDTIIDFCPVCKKKTIHNKW